MLIDRPFEMELGAALVICRPYWARERQAKGARELKAGPQTKGTYKPP